MRDGRPQNLPPSAVVKATPATGTVAAPATVTFDATTSTDPDGTITAYRWHVGESLSSSAAAYQHRFTEPGTYTVRLEVTDNRGATHETTSEYRMLAGALKLPDGDVSIDVVAGNTASFHVDALEEWTIAASEPWISLEPTAGTVGSTLVTLTVDEATLPLNTTATVTLTGASGDTDTVAVKMLQPALSGPFSDRIELRTMVGREKQSDFRIMNSGEGTLRVDLESSAHWLTVSPASALIAPGDDNPQFVVTAWCESKAVRVGTITIASNAPDTAPSTVTVELDCVDDVGSEYRIDLRYYGETILTPEQRGVFNAAATRWSEVIVGDLPGQPLTLPAHEGCEAGEPPLDYYYVDDLLIWVTLVPMDGRGGILGWAGPCLVRGTAPHLPLLGVMAFDLDDFEWMQEQGMLESVILHEMGHVLGIGTLWEVADLDHFHLDAPCHSGALHRRFTGAHANGKHFAAGGGANMLLVETDGGPGTACAHWDEDAYYNELMTGWVDANPNPLSAITIGSLADLGYQVDYTMADPYNVPLAGAIRAQSAGPRMNLENFLRPTPVPVPAGG